VAYFVKPWGRDNAFLTFPSRYLADELFRAFKSATIASGNLRQTVLQRETPQFWSYDPINGQYS
jgi:hypothetical protein